MQLFRALTKWEVESNPDRITKKLLSLCSMASLFKLWPNSQTSTTQPFKGMRNHGLQHKPTWLKSRFWLYKVSWFVCIFKYEKFLCVDNPVSGFSFSPWNVNLMFTSRKGTFTSSNDGKSKVLMVKPIQYVFNKIPYAELFHKKS